MSEELNTLKLQILSLGSLGGMFIGSVITYFIHKPFIVLMFMVCFFFSIYGIAQLKERGFFS